MSREEETCSICMCELTNPRTLPCKHTFCSKCLDHACATGFRNCPTCRVPIGKPEGTQPRNCKMHVSRDGCELPGYPGCGTIIISYHIPAGVQTREHPHPGTPYPQDHRSAYLPDNAEGNEALRLLREAFKMRLTFTIGRSVTRGVDNVVVWNDIHHKTNRTGGMESYGYPDPTYIQRLKEDLAARGVK